MNPYGGEGPVQVTGTRNRQSQRILDEWKEAVDIAYDTQGFMALFDYRGVVNKLSPLEGGKVGLHLSHQRQFNFLCSKGKKYADATVTESYSSPILAEFDGLIFADYEEGRYERVKLRRDEGWPNKAIRIAGDKGAITGLLGKPAILFDDKPINLYIFERSFPKNAGVYVNLERRRHPQAGYPWYNCPYAWPQVVDEYAGWLDHQATPLFEPQAPDSQDRFTDDLEADGR